MFLITVHVCTSCAYALRLGLELRQLSPFDSIYLFPIYLVVTCRESWFISDTEIGVDLQHKLWWMVWLRHWALSLVTFWHWDKKRLVAFQIWLFQHHLGLDQRMQIGFARRTLEWIWDETVASVFRWAYHDTLDDVVASSPLWEVDSSVTAIKTGSRVVLY